MEYFLLFLEWIGMRASIQTIIFSQPVMFHSIEWGGGEFSPPPACAVQNWVSHAAKRVHHWLLCSLAPFVNACWFLAGLLFRHHFPAGGIFSLQEQIFPLLLNLKKCFLARSSSWAVSFQHCHSACHLTLLIWCHLWTGYHVVLCPCAGHWLLDMATERPCRALLIAGCQQGINH